MSLCRVKAMVLLLRCLSNIMGKAAQQHFIYGARAVISSTLLCYVYHPIEGGVLFLIALYTILRKTKK